MSKRTASRLAAWSETVDAHRQDIDALQCLAYAYDRVLFPVIGCPAASTPSARGAYTTEAR